MGFEVLEGGSIVWLAAVRPAGLTIDGKNVNKSDKSLRRPALRSRG